MAARRKQGPRELTDELGRLIGRSRRVVWHAIGGRLATIDESIFEWQLLMHVVRRSGLTQRELAELSQQHPAGVCRTLEELEGQGLVARRRDDADRRKVRVVATGRGLAKYEQIFPETIAAVDEVLRPLTQAERVQLRGLLRKVLAPSDTP